MRALAERDARVGWTSTPAGALRFAVRGPEDAPPLLLLHGLGDSLAGWSQLAGPLSRRHRLHLIDLPGHGLSHRPPDWKFSTLLAGVAHYARELRDPILLGHSLGGWIALKLAAAQAVKPRRIVLVNPGGAALAREEWAPFVELISARDREGVQRYFERAFFRAPMLLRLFPSEIVKAMWADCSRGILGAVEDGDFLRASDLAELQAPVRLVWGTSDRMLPDGTFDFFRRALPRAEITLLEKAGHLPHLEAPRALARALLKTLQD
jgi:pimeloyl-ACP methyl ester carboxylesterase